MRRSVLVTLAVSSALATLSSRPAFGQATERLAVIPKPVTLIAGHGEFVLTGKTVIWTDKADSGVARHFARELAPATGFDLAVHVGISGQGNRIVFKRAAARDTSLGAEGYRLDVKPGVVTITSSAPGGAFYATQTLRQLLPPDVFRTAEMAGERWTVPATSITDRPRFQWRGMHLDVSRHFMPKEFVKKYIDLLALYKMNTFHWHLTDDQGWRIEIKKYPRLTQVGAWRSETVVGHVKAERDSLQNVYDKKPHGGFYTQDDVREIVAYARDRFVTIVPEIEMPGHSQAAIAAYPWLGNFGDTVKVWNRWGVTPHILNPSDTTIAFMQDVLTEVMALFPGPFIHIGGDEAIKPEWKTSPRAQAKIEALGLPGAPAGTRPADTLYWRENELQSWFIGQMDTFLTAHHRRLIGWDEILEGGLAPNAVVMSWRGTAGGIAAAQAGHDVVMTPGSHTYFDHYQSSNHDVEPLAIGGFLPIDTVYSYEPVPAQLDATAATHILGAQGQVWTEYIEGPKNVEYMAFPRAAALAEALWTPQADKNFADFMARLGQQTSILQALDVNYRPLTPPIPPAITPHADATTPTAPDRNALEARSTKAAVDTSDERWPTGTFSILAYDPTTGEFGGAVQSRVFSVGNGVLWAEAGVGAAATQAIVDVGYGPQALELLRQGKSAQEVVKTVMAADKDPDPVRWSKEGRQFAVIDAKGNVFAYTGPKAPDSASQKFCSGAGMHCTAQGNTLASKTVVDSMVARFERTPGHLAYRLVAALEGGQSAGGDHRGQQSAALVIVKKNGGVWVNNDVVLHLQVDDNPEPIKELRRLVEKAAAVRQIPKAP